MKLPKYTIIGLMADVFDLLIIGLLPILGDAFDVGMIVLWYTVLKSPVALVGAIELIPLADILPIHTALGLYADMKVKK